MHYFDESLAASHAGAGLPLWEAMYRQSFPDFHSMQDFPKDGEHQRCGIDRAVTLTNSKRILIDEKLRGRNKKTGEVYDDIAVEHISNDRTGSLGWGRKPLRCDYIAYAIAPLGLGYLLPVIQLQQAWENNSEKWMRRYFEITADNLGYNTISYGIPVDVLFKAIGKCLRLSFTKFEVEE